VTSIFPLRSYHTPEYKAGRIRAIFELPRHLSYMSKEKLVYIEHFRPFSRGNPMPHRMFSTSHEMANGERKTSVIPLSAIRMACHLAPRFKSLSEMCNPITSQTDLLSLSKEFYFNKYCSHFTFTVMEHWQKHGGHCKFLYRCFPGLSPIILYTDPAPARNKGPAIGTTNRFG
jgi:hypothetical protein